MKCVTVVIRSRDTLIELERMIRHRFVHHLLRARDYQARYEFDQLQAWWREVGQPNRVGVCALTGLGGAGKTATVERFLRILPDVLPTDLQLPKRDDLATPDLLFVYSFYDASNVDVFFAQLASWLKDEPYDDSTRIPSYLETRYLLEAMTNPSQRAAGTAKQPSSCLLIMDGLEKAQDVGFRGGVLGRIEDGRLRDLIKWIADGLMPNVRLLITTRFRLIDLQALQVRFFLGISVEKLSDAAAVALLRSRGVHGADYQLSSVAEEQGHHALSVDLIGSFISRFCSGDPANLPPLPLANLIREPQADIPAIDPVTAAIREQERRFTRLAHRYREALASSDSATLALLERVCLFRVGADAHLLASIFTGPDRGFVGGAMAHLSAPAVQIRLDTLAELRLIERAPDNTYCIHPAVRDGFLHEFDRTSALAGHNVVREQLMTRLASRPGESYPSDPKTVDQFEEIVHHTIKAGLHEFAWELYISRLGGYRNLGWRLSAFERGLRICQAFLDGESSNWTSPVSLPHTARVSFNNEMARYLISLGRLREARNSLLLNSSIRLENKTTTSAWEDEQIIASVVLLSGALGAARRHCEDAVRRAKMLGPVEHRLSISILAYTSLLSGNSHLASQAVLGRNLQCLFHFADPMHRLYASYGVRVFERLGKIEIAEKLATDSRNILRDQWGPAAEGVSQCNLVIASARLAQGKYDEARVFLHEANEWAVGRDAKEILCWCALVEAQIYAAQASAARSRSADGAPEMIRGGLESVELGLRIARDCGYAIYHVDLLLLRAKLRLELGLSTSAREDALTAMYGLHHPTGGQGPFDAPALTEAATATARGIFPNKETLLPKLLAARHPDCAYAWGEAEGRHVLAEALLLEAAGVIRCSTISPEEARDPRNLAHNLISSARRELEKAISIRQRIGDPELVRSKHTMRRLSEGRLTPYPIVPSSVHVGPTLIMGQVSGGSSSIPAQSMAPVAQKFRTIADVKGKVDFALITIKEEELKAVLDQFRGFPESVSGARDYALLEVPQRTGRKALVAVTRCPAQGNGVSQDIARDIIDELDPAWILVVGIAGGAPVTEFTLGDVVLASSLLDFSVEAVKAKRKFEFAVEGREVDPRVENFVTMVAAHTHALEAWNNLTVRSYSDTDREPLPKPRIDLDDGNFYGSRTWQRDVRLHFEHHAKRANSAPLVTAVPLGSSDRLIKSDEIMRVWLRVARQVRAVEMESAGVYLAARGRGSTRRTYPTMSVRGISDIIGFRRDEKWTRYACEAAAAFAFAFVRSGYVPAR